MKLDRILFVCPIIVAIALLASLPVLGPQAASAASGPEDSGAVVESTGEIPPGNYCVSCHTADDSVLAVATGWMGGNVNAQNSPCPAVRDIQEELYLTERLMLAIDNSRSRLGETGAARQIDARLAGITTGYNELLDKPVSSLDAFVSEAQVLRYQLGKIYTQLNDLHEASLSRLVLVISLVVSLVVLGSLAWGYWNSRGWVRGENGQRALPWKPAVVVLLVFAVFALPIFRNFAPEDISTEEEQEIQATFDLVERSRTAAERSQARAWVLAKVAAHWNTDSARQAEQLAESLLAEKETRLNASALWGQAQAVREAAGLRTVDKAEASLTAGELAAIENRSWSLRMIAQEWLAVAPEKAQEILSDAQRQALSEEGIYRDLDLAGIAFAWQEVNPQAGADALRSIRNSSVRSWADRVLSGDYTGVNAQDADSAYALYLSGDYPAAWEKAAEIVDPVDRSRAQSAIAAAWVNADAAREIDLPLFRERALRQIAVAAQDLVLAQSLEQPYEKILALALLGEYEAAWEIAQANPAVDGLPLVVLGTRWAETNPEAALELVEAIETEVDKAAVLRAAAASSGDEAVFQRALDLALAARVRGDALSPVIASLDLALSMSDPEFAEAAFAQAYEAAQRISIK